MLGFGTDTCSLSILQCWTRFCKSSDPRRMQRGPAGRWNRVWQPGFASEINPGKSDKKMSRSASLSSSGGVMELCLKGRGEEERDDTGGRDWWFCLKENESLSSPSASSWLQRAQSVPKVSQWGQGRNKSQRRGRGVPKQHVHPETWLLITSCRLYWAFAATWGKSASCRKKSGFRCR